MVPKIPYVALNDQRHSLDNASQAGEGRDTGTEQCPPSCTMSGCHTSVPDLHTLSKNAYLVGSCRPPINKLDMELLQTIP